MLWLLPALAVYFVLAGRLDFYQDDAFISYRYVANLLSGHGLVYNIGEHVEGYTNFGWIIYLAFWGVLGANFILVSKITGYLLGAAIVVVAYLTARLVFDEKHRWFALAVAYIVAFNQSLAYWAPAGLETAAFTLAAMLSLYFFLRRSRLLIASLTYAVLLRPEGALVAALLVLIELIQTRRLPRFSFTAGFIAFIFCLPFVGFKLAYYGSILPNPLFAKTSYGKSLLDVTQFRNGLEYTWRFLSHYGFWGTFLIIPLLFWKRLSWNVRNVWLFTAGYMCYIIFVGGDVLKVHRFFLPLFGTVAILLTVSVRVLTGWWNDRIQRQLLVLVLVPMLALTVYLPYDFVTGYNFTEKAFIAKMKFKARELKKADSTNFSVALPTIGAFGYELLGHDVIDMLGLTDSTIARYSEEPIEGMESTWKEQKHNSRYLLERAPDYIIFSTGIKPSAPAEKALMLYPQFLESYRTIAWYFDNPDVPGKGTLSTVFKRVRPVTGDIRPTYPADYVEYYKMGLDAAMSGNHRRALQYYNRALQVSPRPYNLYLLYQKAFSHMMLREDSVTGPILESILQRDSMVYEAHKDLYIYSLAMGKRDEAQIHKRWLKRLVPWYVPRLDTLASQILNVPLSSL
jgi:arabinofuranosyltransferase